MKKRVLSLVSVLATVVATMVASSACMWYVYQPEEPKSLQK